MKKSNLPDPEQSLYSIRMRATAGNKHVSGAERIVTREQIDRSIADLISRALAKTGSCDKIELTADNLKGTPIRRVSALDIITVTAPDPARGRSLAAQALLRTGVATEAIETAIHYLSSGPAPSGQNMRGAMIMDSQTGERLEKDFERGVRASRFDWSDGTGMDVDGFFARAGLSHFRTREALALATKVAHAPAIIAELCWSDDPDYTAGYVASRTLGYVRFPFLKKQGDDKGGRVFFVDRQRLDRESLVAYLENEAVLVVKTGTVREMSPEEYVRRNRHRRARGHGSRVQDSSSEAGTRSREKDRVKGKAKTDGNKKDYV